MSWNDSGGNKNPGPRNPWDRKPESGPPDLDEIMRNLRRRLGGLFGRRPGPARDGEGGGLGGSSYTLIGLVVLGGWLASGIYTVGPAEKAVITRFGRFDRIEESGAHWRLPSPLEAKQLVNTQEVLSATDHTRMLTQDEALVDINIAVQFRRAEPKAVAFNVVFPEQTLGDASESAIREIIGQNTLEYVLAKGRQDIALKTKLLIQRTLDSYRSGLEIISVNLQDVSVPEQVAPSQKDAIKAREDKDRLRVEAETYSNDILPRARGTAQQQILDAEAYRQRVVADAEGESSRFAQLAAAYEKAPAVTRQRLYLETMETVLGNAKAAKILVDTKGTGNMIYLPLDKLLEKRAGDAARAQPTLPEVTVTPAPSRGEAVDAAADARSRARGNR
ncbi:MAG TPA: FtsH protease activity modulator HflK [Steroidobacteraceae bacterium]|nr:FtsH protease activity modulator HflK [Steroidobacteraceae bacterium]